MTHSSSSSTATTLRGSNNKSKFRKEFDDIIQRWVNGKLVQVDIDFLEQFTFSDDEYEQLLEDSGVKGKIELYKHKIKLDEFVSPVHEYMNRRIERLLDRAYGDALHGLGSASISFVDVKLTFRCDVRRGTF